MNEATDAEFRLARIREARQAQATAWEEYQEAVTLTKDRRRHWQECKTRVDSLLDGEITPLPLFDGPHANNGGSPGEARPCGMVEIVCEAAALTEPLLEVLPGLDATEPVPAPEQPAPEAQVGAAPAASGEPIEGLGLTAEALTAAYVADKWCGEIAPGAPLKVQAVTIDGRPWVCIGMAWFDGDRHTEWQLLPLYTPREWVTARPGHEPTTPAFRPATYGQYEGVRVKVGRREYVIGPHSEMRTVVQRKEAQQA